VIWAPVQFNPRDCLRASGTARPPSRGDIRTNRHQNWRAGIDMTLRLRLLATICLPLFVATCRDTPSSDPYRCLAGVNLGELIRAEAPPQVQSQGWSSSSITMSSENRLFDGEQEASLVLDNPGPFIGRLCNRLKDQLAERCDVERFWSGAEHCAAFLESPSAAVTSPQGVYTRRSVLGRVALFASRTTEGKTVVLLTTTEWSN
jgi:hypothetical protein